MTEHQYLVEQAERREAELAHIARVLGSADCCTYGCTQSPHCPARTLTTANGGARINKGIPMPRHTTPTQRPWFDVAHGTLCILIAATLTLASIFLGLAAAHFFYHWRF